MYSVDSVENKQNPYTPSESLSLNEQLMYRLAALDASMNAGFRRLDEKMDRFQSDLHDTQIATNDRINHLDKEFREAIAFKRARIDQMEKDGRILVEAYDKRIVEIETWQKLAMARIGVAFTAVLLVWTVFAPTIRNFLGIANG